MNQSINQFACDQCDKICKSKTGLSSHLRAHLRKPNLVVVQVQQQTFACELCDKVCKSKTGLQSHLRSHQRKSNLVVEQMPKTRSILRNSEKKVKTNRIRIAEFIREQKIIEMTMPQPVFERVETVEQNEFQNEFQCIVCYESVQEIVKCPVCIALYCNSCYDRCKNNRCAQCRQVSDMFIVRELQEEESIESDYESESEETSQQRYQYWMNMINESRIAIYQRLQIDPDFRISVMYTRREIDSIYLRLYKLVLQNAKLNNGESILTQIESRTLYITPQSSFTTINVALNRFFILVYADCDERVFQHSPVSMTWELCGQFLLGYDMLYTYFE